MTRTTDAQAWMTVSRVRELSENATLRPALNSPHCVPYVPVPLVAKAVRPPGYNSMRALWQLAVSELAREDSRKRNAKVAR